MVAALAARQLSSGLDEQLGINRKRVQRLMREHRLLQPKRSEGRRKRPATWISPRSMELVRPLGSRRRTGLGPRLPWSPPKVPDATRRLFIEHLQRASNTIRHQEASCLVDTESCQPLTEARLTLEAVALA